MPPRRRTCHEAVEVEAVWRRPRRVQAKAVPAACSTQVHRSAVDGSCVTSSQSMDVHHRRGRPIHPKSAASAKIGWQPSCLEASAASAGVISTFSTRKPKRRGASWRRSLSRNSAVKLKR